MKRNIKWKTKKKWNINDTKITKNCDKSDKKSLTKNIKNLQI